MKKLNSLFTDQVKEALIVTIILATIVTFSVIFI